MIDDQEAIIEPVGDDATGSATPAEETQAPETEDVQPESTDDGEYQDTGSSLKKGAQARIRELNAKAKRAEERAKSLEEQLSELTHPVGREEISFTPQYNPQEPVIKPGEEIDINELNRRLSDREQKILAQAEARAELKTRQLEAITRINTEAHKAMESYPELDPDSDAYDPELSQTVTEAVLELVKANPYSASPKKFVDSFMRPFKRQVTKQVGKDSENIAKQVSQSAVRPTAVTTKSTKSHEEKSISELEAEFGFTY